MGDAGLEIIALAVAVEAATSRRTFTATKSSLVRVAVAAVAAVKMQAPAAAEVEGPMTAKLARVVTAAFVTPTRVQELVVAAAGVLVVKANLAQGAMVQELVGRVTLGVEAATVAAGMLAAITVAGVEAEAWGRTSTSN
jgi:hypothetical protein